MSDRSSSRTRRTRGPSHVRARACLVLVAVGLGGLTLLPAWRGFGAADGGTPEPVPVAPAAVTAVPPSPSPPPRPRLGPGAPPAAPSVAVYPPQALPLSFDHARHARRGIGCERCHAEAARSVSAKDNLLPGEQPCRACHAIDRSQPQKAVAPGQPPARCDACHTGPGGASVGVGGAEPALPVIAAPALKFNHRLHVERGQSCQTCHGDIERLNLATRVDLPKMGLCLACHDGRQATSRCAACHPTLPDGRLRTQFPSGRLVPSGSLRGIDAHTQSFRTEHRVAGRDQRYCATCHTQNECTDCHATGVIRPPDFHPVDYATLHAVDARRNTPNCSSCHRNQTFCLGCHQRLGVAPDPEGGQAGRQPNNPFGTGTGVKRFHPPGWVRDDAGIVLTAPTPASHSFQARRNLRTCVSCHREESCLTCHSADPARSMGISPHPPGFGASATCRALSDKNARACLKCHSPGAAALSCDR